MICQCEMTASSSLHGLIVSDAYHVPNVWICLNSETGGGEFKFKDYYAGVQRDFIRYDVKERIDKNKIVDYCSKYKGINFDSQSLLNCCPFL